MKSKRLILFVLAIAIGAGIGLGIGWLAVPPMPPENASLSQLRQDYQADLALMAAEQYAVRQDARAALTVLGQVNKEDPVNYLVSAIKFGENNGFTADEIGQMRALFNAIDAKTLSDWKAGR